MVNIINEPENEHWTICTQLVDTNEALKALMGTIVRCIKPTIWYKQRWRSDGQSE